MSGTKIQDALQIIIDSESGYAIAKQIGVNPVQINRLKNKSRKLENISIDLAQKLLDAYDNVEIKLKDPS